MAKAAPLHLGLARTAAASFLIAKELLSECVIAEAASNASGQGLCDIIQARAKRYQGESSRPMRPEVEAAMTLLSIEEQRALIAEEIAAYEKMRENLEANHLNEWVVIYKGEFIGAYSDFQEAAAEAIERFGRGPYLIRQVGVEDVMRPSFSRVNAGR